MMLGKISGSRNGTLLFREMTLMPFLLHGYDHSHTK